MPMTLIHTKSAAALFGLLLLSAIPSTGQAEVVPYPTRQELRRIQLDAFNCSRENSQEACRLTRQGADPLMDHPRLSVICKDALWNLIQVAVRAPENSFQRRDEIDKPARRLTVICIDPAKPEQQKPPKQGGLIPSQT